MAHTYGYLHCASEERPMALAFMRKVNEQKERRADEVVVGEKEGGRRKGLEAAIFLNCAG